MQLKPVTRALVDQPADVLILGLYEGEASLTGDAAAVNKVLKGLVERVIASGEFKGKYCQTVYLHAPADAQVKAALLIGLGKRDDLDVRRLKGVAVAAGRFLAGKKVATAAVPVLGRGLRGLTTSDAIETIAEGFERSTFHIHTLKSAKDDEPKPLRTVFVAGVKEEDASAARRAIEVGQAIGQGANLARDLVNTPANLLSPAQFADRAAAIARKAGLKVTVLDERQLKRLGMNAILSVGQGSSRPPRLVLIRYEGGGATRYGFVGKGICFDSGGISIKPAAGMEDMKMDMSGAAAVLGAMQTIARLKPKANILGVMALAENLPSGTASRPGDVVTTHKGKTVEIISTDAEGRLVLCDALAYAIEQGATRVIDLATLTGACVIALGHEASGLMTNNADWAAAVRQAGDRAGERTWELPLWPEYHEGIESKIADIKNVGAEREAGTIAGGMFLKDFVGETPWVHLDIAGTAYLKRNKPDQPEGATGVGVATMLRLVL